MKKKYCIHCKTLYTEESVCSRCGKSEFQAIIIDVQNQHATIVLTEHLSFPGTL